MCTLDCAPQASMVNLTPELAAVLGTQWTGSILNGQVMKERLRLEAKDLVYIIGGFHILCCKKELLDIS